MNEIVNWWQHIYSHINPVAFSLFGFKVHWYALMYITALIVGYFAALKFGEKFGIDRKIIDDYFVWAEIGIILGARIGYFIFYVPHNGYYFLHPWEMFNPFHDGKLVGIRGMSYHGAVIGYAIATVLFVKKKKVDLWKLQDAIALAIPLGYTFGRIGNFLNKGLCGRITSDWWGIYVNGVLRYPSQLLEAFFEGIVTFLVLYFYYKKFYKCKGELISLYLITYGIFRSFCELYRQPDPQLGFIFYHVTMGQILSFFMIIVGIVLFVWRRKKCEN
jgi:phosphatidylglycerol:prolipoprotein diacylglycerol transferase